MLLQSADLQLEPMKEVTGDCQKTSAVSTGNIEALDFIEAEQQKVGANSPPQEPVAQTIASPCATSFVEQVSYTCKTFVNSFVDPVLYGHRKLLRFWYGAGVQYESMHAQFQPLHLMVQNLGAHAYRRAVKRVVTDC